jgi:hypothetical protein
VSALSGYSWVSGFFVFPCGLVGARILAGTRYRWLGQESGLIENRLAVALLSHPRAESGLQFAHPCGVLGQRSEVAQLVRIGAEVVEFPCRPFVVSSDDGGGGGVTLRPGKPRRAEKGVWPEWR